jgi:hypothetical protein
MKDIDNLVPASQVRMAGVQIGEVRKTTSMPDGVLIQFAVTDKNVAPLHEGLTVRIGARSLVEDSYLDITDGRGPALPDSSTLPASAVQYSTQVDDVLRSLDPKTRDNLGSLLRSVGQGTQERPHRPRRDRRTVGGSPEPRTTDPDTAQCARHGRRPDRHPGHRSAEDHRGHLRPAPGDRRNDANAARRAD